MTVRARVPIADRSARPVTFSTSPVVPATVVPAPVATAPGSPARADRRGHAADRGRGVPVAPLEPPAPVAPVVEASAGPIDAAPAGPSNRRPRGNRRSWALAAAAVVLLGAGATAVVTAGRTAPSVPSAGSAGSAAPAVATWLRDTLGPAATVVTDDPDLRARLATRGVTVALAAPATASPGSYVLRAAASDATGPLTTTVAGGRTWVPVARFGGAADVVEVGQLVGRPAADIVRDRAAERATARAASAGLLANPGVTVAPDVRSVFATGGLDLRAAAFLAVLAAGQPVHVLDVAADPAESAAGGAARTVAVTVADLTALRDDLARASGSYAPVVATPAPGTDLPVGSVILTWPLLADPTLVVT